VIISPCPLHDRCLIMSSSLSLSLFEDGLGSLFEFTSSFVVQLLLFGHGSCSVWLNSSCWLSTHAHRTFLRLSWRSSVILDDGARRCIGVCSICHFARIGIVSCSLGGVLGSFANDVEHTVLESLLVLAQSVLLPSVVEHVRVKAVPLHARREEADTRGVVRLLLEGERSAVLHELSEFDGVPAAKLGQRRFNLLLLDVVVLFVLAPTWQTLPWERTLNQVKQYVANGLKIVSSRLLDTLVRRN